MLEAEKFKASIEKSTGKVNTEITDDQFFHLLCHIDEMLVSKIERGEFLDLEKLLSGDHLSKPGDDSRLEFQHMDFTTYLAPVSSSREKKITHIRKWEQAFRVYASIYCHANPTRTTEIWQYIDVINTAASAYVWKNVSKYNYTFCQLMAFNPNRSWSTIYNHVWNLSMTEPIQRNRDNNGRGGSSNGNKRRSSEGGRRDLSDSFWSFNKGHCKFGSKCDWINRCKYCDLPSHGKNSCYKLAEKKRSESGKSRRERKYSEKSEKSKESK